MTTEEIRELIAGIGLKTAEVAELQRLGREELRETERLLKEGQQETDRELKEVARRQQETDRELEKVARLQQETALQQKETALQIKDTDRQIRELKTQIGGLGNKFGGFTEGLALPSMTRLLENRFHMDVVSPRIRSRNNGHSMEVDVLAFSKRPEVDEVFVVEVKSHLREDGIDQMKKILRDVRQFYPIPPHKKVYGILAVVDAPEEVWKRVLDAGIYLARIHDEEFELTVPEGFQPQAF